MTYYQKNKRKVLQRQKAYFKAQPEKRRKTARDCAARIREFKPEKEMLAQAKRRAKMQGFQFDIDAEDIIIPEFCPLLQIKLERNKGGSGPTGNSPSLDRIDSNKGYVKGNVWVISHRANMIKCDATLKEFQQIAKNWKRLVS